MSNLPAQQFFKFNAISEHPATGEGGGSGLRHVPSSAPRLPLFSGAQTQEQCQVVYGDSSGIKTTKFFRSGLLKYYLRSIKKNGHSVHAINTQIQTFELYSRPDNLLVRKIISEIPTS